MEHSEQLQRHQAAVPQVQQPQMSPEWRSFIEANPRLAQNFDLAYAAAAQAHNEGHQVNSRGQMERTLELVDKHLARPHAEEPAPEFKSAPPGGLCSH